MKKIISLIVAVMAMSTIAFAGGEIQPVEPVVATPGVDSMSFDGLYVGAGYSMVKGDTDYDYNDDDIYEWIGGEKTDNEAWMLQAGYKFNQYISIEGRYWKGIGTKLKYSEDIYLDTSYVNSDSGINSAKFSSFGVYVKPTLPLTEELSVYALVGYGQTKLDYKGSDFDVLNETGFQWGLGGSYAVTEDISVFADYVKLANNVDDTYQWDGLNYYRDWTVNKVDTINFGVTYNF